MNTPDTCLKAVNDVVLALEGELAALSQPGVEALEAATARKQRAIDIMRAIPLSAWERAQGREDLAAALDHCQHLNRRSAAALALRRERMHALAQALGGVTCGYDAQGYNAPRLTRGSYGSV